MTAARLDPWVNVVEVGWTRLAVQLDFQAFGQEDYAVIESSVDPVPLPGAVNPHAYDLSAMLAEAAQTTDETEVTVRIQFAPPGQDPDQEPAGTAFLFRWKSVDSGAGYEEGEYLQEIRFNYFLYAEITWIYDRVERRLRIEGAHDIEDITL